MFKNILVPIHLSYTKNHKKLFKGAFEVLNEDGKITLLFVNQNRTHGSVYPILDDEKQINYDNDAMEQLKEIARVHSLPMDKVSFKIKDGTVHNEILEEAKKIKADAIVMMATRPGLGSYFISSTAERVIRHAHCSVFVIRLDDIKI
ncbi:universal stress protein [Arcobacter sp.]|uniref:universal stress protein n=1 Tax=Arcobacter sp. TaxID=1872629 RepID=UPI003D0A90E8